MRRLARAQIIPMALALLLLFGANFIERMWLPVIKDFSVLQISRTPTTVTMSGYMRKARDCKFLGIAATADYVTGEQDEVPLKLNIGGNRYYTRPTGTQPWGPWEITIPATPETIGVRFAMSHSCHPFWTSPTDIGFVPLPKLAP